jgi:predicted nucleic acid-binding protein
MLRYAYLDASAIVKLVVAEPETAALEQDVINRPGLVSSRLGAVEVRRAARRSGQRRILQRAEDVFESIVFVEVTPTILDRAGALAPEDLRTLDAIHLATAEALNISPLDVISYDGRLAEAAKAHGLSVCQPGARSAIRNGVPLLPRRRAGSARLTMKVVNDLRDD